MTKDRLVIMSFALGAFMLAATHAQSQSRNCAAHNVVVERLGSHYGESRQSVGLGADSSVVEIFASSETGTWTITVTRPGGPTCMVAVGDNYQYLNEPLANFDSES
ncbi:MAG: hypothetical protein AAGF56_11230 [Pseudomonadota bacterium]